VACSNTVGSKASRAPPFLVKGGHGKIDGQGMPGFVGIIDNIMILLYKAPVAQLDRALPSEGKGQQFESARVHQVFCGYCFINQRKY
jgi:hypothetical protein